MKTFIAENVLCDWNCGMIVVKAENKNEAVKLVMEELKKELGEYRASILYEDCYEDEYSEYRKNKDNEGCLKCKLRELQDNEVIYMEGSS